MLSFYLIADEQSTTTSVAHLKYAGGVEEEEFEMGLHLGIIEGSADYYGKFRWSSEQVISKKLLLDTCPFRARTCLHDILGQANAAGVGLVACGD